MNSTEPAWDIRSDQTTRKVWVDISADDTVTLTEHKGSGRTFRPGNANVTIANGRDVAVTVSGAIVKKDGTSGAVRVEAKWCNPHTMYAWDSRPLDTAPEWVRRLVAEVTR